MPTSACRPPHANLHMPTSAWRPPHGDLRITFHDWHCRHSDSSRCRSPHADLRMPISTLHCTFHDWYCIHSDSSRFARAPLIKPAEWLNPCGHVSVGKKSVRLEQLLTELSLLLLRGRLAQDLRSLQPGVFSTVSSWSTFLGNGLGGEGQATVVQQYCHLALQALGKCY